jgi:sec-independent protein translocase protein TatB
MPFDIGFIELCIILIVSLIVLGPDKLPTAARALTRFYQSFSRTANSFKREVSRELQMDELKRQLQDQQKQLASVVGDTNEGLNKKIPLDAQQQDNKAQPKNDSAPEGTEQNV